MAVQFPVSCVSTSTKQRYLMVPCSSCFFKPLTQPPKQLPNVWTNLWLIGHWKISVDKRSTKKKWTQWWHAIFLEISCQKNIQGLQGLWSVREWVGTGMSGSGFPKFWKFNRKHVEVLGPASTNCARAPLSEYCDYWSSPQIIPSFHARDQLSMLPLQHLRCKLIPWWDTKIEIYTWLPSMINPSICLISVNTTWALLSNDRYPLGLRTHHNCRAVKRNTSSMSQGLS